ncbi:MAG: ZIP family metal transporter, partial [Oscillospiraceae bacterium]|nr:ZIP family metal transporter [Oscillospiraceae bacterium]
LRRPGTGKGRAFLWGALSGAVEPVFGLLAFLLAGAARPAMPWLLSFSAGAMLYVTVHELAPEARSDLGAFGYVGGFALMMALDVALG